MSEVELKTIKRWTPERRRRQFLRRVSIGGINECWWWKGSSDGTQGYGRVANAEGRKIAAHRMAYELLVGEIPPGMFVLHRCDNPPCVNPKHLFVGTAKDNTQDMFSKGRHGRPNSKLTLSQVREIKELLREGHTLNEIASRYGVTDQNISSIKRGETWRHV